MIKSNKDIHSKVSAIILSNGVSDLLYAWRLSQALIMTTHFSHEIDASRLRLTTKVRFGNPTDNPTSPKGGYFKVSYPIFKYYHNNKLIFTSSETDQNFNLDKGDEICFDPVNALILRQSIPDLFRNFQGKETVNFIAEIKSIINERILLIRTEIVRI